MKLKAVLNVQANFVFNARIILETVLIVVEIEQEISVSFAKISMYLTKIRKIALNKLVALQIVNNVMIIKTAQNVKKGSI